MAKYDRISTTMNQTEAIAGWLWLIFQLLGLPHLLRLANSALGNPLNGGWISFLFACINFLGVLVIFRSFLGRSVTDFGKSFLRCIRGAFLGFCVYYVSNLAMGNLMGFLFPWFSNVNDGQVASLLGLNYLPMVIAAVVLVPVAEELLYRGILFQTVYVKNRKLAWMLSTALFCLIHVLPYIGSRDVLTLVLSFLQYIPAGLCLAWAYTEADNIFAPILIHAVVNAMGVYAVR